ncbi:MAG TPA: HAD-IA family hydrolase [Thermoplasmata archaeon]|nr:HAD-IA family hydrolase [Thermoplasmata archaeon]
MSETPRSRAPAPPGAAPVRAVTFDLWHTLLYLEPGDEDEYNRSQGALGLETLQEAPVTGPATLAPAEAVRRASQEAGDRSEQGESVSLSAQIERAAALAGRTVEPARYVGRIERLVASSPFRVAPGAQEVMADLAGRGVRIGVVANTVGEPGRALQRICEREGLGRFVDAWSWSDELPWTKPSPKIFLHCLGELGGTPPRAFHVGDAIWDIEGARRAGFAASVLYTGLARYGTHYRTVVMTKDPAAAGPDYTIHLLGELPALVDRVLGPGSTEK